MKKSRLIPRFPRRVPGLPVAGVAAIALMLGPPPLSAASTPVPAGEVTPSVVGTIGGQPLSAAEVISASKPDFDRLDNDYEREYHALQSKYARARHDLLQRKSDEVLDRRALELEVASRGVGMDAVLAGLQAPLVSEEDVRSFYEANKARTTQSYEAMAPQIRRYLTATRSDAAKRSFYADLRSRNGVRSYLTPYRVEIAATGPARGPSGAVVTIVEFADFQCPYCKQAEGTLHTLLADHPQDVRLVFRNLPLTPMHPNAEIAAAAGICAGRLGKFWEMHDAMYQDQGALTHDALVETAQRLGLDTDRFSACLSDRSTREALDSDARAALELGLGSTPYFFINGRPLDGSVPLEKFESIIGEELERTPAQRTAQARH